MTKLGMKSSESSMSGVSQLSVIRKIVFGRSCIVLARARRLLILSILLALMSITSVCGSCISVAIGLASFPSQ